MLLPLVAARYLRRPVLWLLVAIGIEVAWRYAGVHLRDITDWLGVGPFAPGVYSQMAATRTSQVPGFLGHFALGMTGAWLFVRLRGSPILESIAWRRALLAIQVVAGVGLAAATIVVGAAFVDIVQTKPGNEPTGVYFRYFGELVVAIAFTVFMVAMLLGPAWARTLWSNRLARWLGHISYGVYLWHLLVLWFAIYTLGITRNFTNEAFVLMLAFVLPYGLLLGWLSQRYVETPAIAWARQWGRRRTERRAEERAAQTSFAPSD